MNKCWNHTKEEFPSNEVKAKGPVEKGFSKAYFGANVVIFCCCCCLIADSIHAVLCPNHESHLPVKNKTCWEVGMKQRNKWNTSYIQTKAKYVPICELRKASLTVSEVKVMHMPPNPFNANAKKIRMDRSTGESNTRRCYLTDLLGRHMTNLTYCIWLISINTSHEPW